MTRFLGRTVVDRGLTLAKVPGALRNLGFGAHKIQSHPRHGLWRVQPSLADADPLARYLTASTFREWQILFEHATNVPFRQTFASRRRAIARSHHLASNTTYHEDQPDLSPGNPTSPSSVTISGA